VTDRNSKCWRASERKKLLLERRTSPLSRDKQLSRVWQSGVWLRWNQNQKSLLCAQDRNILRDDYSPKGSQPVISFHGTITAAFAETLGVETLHYLTSRQTGLRRKRLHLKVSQWWGNFRLFGFRPAAEYGITYQFSFAPKVRTSVAEKLDQALSSATEWQDWIEFHAACNHSHSRTNRRRYSSRYRWTARFFIM